MLKLCKLCKGFNGNGEKDGA